MKEKAAYLKGLIDGLGIDETTKEGKVIKAMSELLGELAEAVDAIDEDVTHAYDQINDLSEELEDLEADLYEDDDTDDDDEEPEEDAEDAEDSGDDDDNADVAGEPYYEVACPACGNTVYVSEDDLDAGEAICPSCNVAFEVALADEDDDEAPEEPDDGPARYEVTCPACGNTVYVSEDDLDAGEAICPSCNVAFEVALADEDDDEAPEEPDDGPARYEVTCPACGATSVVDEEALLDGEPVCPACGKPLDFEVTEE